MFEKILLPIHQSKEALETTKKAIELARNQNSCLIMLIVFEPGHLNSKETESSHSLIKRSQDLIHEASIEFEVLRREGKPVVVICDMAEELNVDLIVMGTQGINLERDQHSTVCRVIELTQCPVFLVP